MALFDANGRERITLLTSFTTPKGLYAPDGSYYAHEYTGSAQVGDTAPDGALWIKFRQAGDKGIYHPSGALYVGGSSPNYYLSGYDTEVGTPPGGGGSTGQPMGLLLALVYP